ncbi:MAG: hypothetical protein R3335_07685 [Anaerolineales bacterium]|nr:hypothetical protein [Anaerolineales bacterium]
MIVKVHPERVIWLIIGTVTALRSAKLYLPAARPELAPRRIGQRKQARAEGYACN